jgi:hypothetical protein
MASEKTLLTRSLVDPAFACRKPRPKVAAAPLVATFLAVEVPRHLEGRWGRTKTTTQKKVAHMQPR